MPPGAQLSDDASSDSCASDDGSNFTITGETSTKTKAVSPNPNRESTPGIASWMMKT